MGRIENKGEWILVGRGLVRRYLIELSVCVMSVSCNFIPILSIAFFIMTPQGVDIEFKPPFLVVNAPLASWEQKVVVSVLFFSSSHNAIFCQAAFLIDFCFSLRTLC
jgi:hypothetical protein